MRTGLLSDLSVIGYEILLEGETIRLRYQKNGPCRRSARKFHDPVPSPSPPRAPRPGGGAR